MNAIVTTRIAPPIALPHFDWQAVREGYEPGNAIGRAPSERAAIEDLFDTEEFMRERNEERRRDAIDQQREAQRARHCADAPF